MQPKSLSLALAGLVLTACTGVVETPSPVVTATPQSAQQAADTTPMKPVEASDFVGDWRGEWATNRGAWPAKLSVQQVGQGGEFVGVYTFWATPHDVRGTIQDNALTFSLGRAHFKFTHQANGRMTVERTVDGEVTDTGVFEKA